MGGPPVQTASESFSFRGKGADSGAFPIALQFLVCGSSTRRTWIHSCVFHVCVSNGGRPCGCPPPPPRSSFVAFAVVSPGLASLPSPLSGSGSPYLLFGFCASACFGLGAGVPPGLTKQPQDACDPRGAVPSQWFLGLPFSGQRVLSRMPGAMLRRGQPAWSWQREREGRYPVSEHVWCGVGSW